MGGPLGYLSDTYQRSEGLEDPQGGALGKVCRADGKGTKEACCIGAGGSLGCGSGGIGRGIDTQKVVEAVLRYRAIIM